MLWTLFTNGVIIFMSSSLNKKVNVFYAELRLFRLIFTVVTKHYQHDFAFKKHWILMQVFVDNIKIHKTRVSCIFMEIYGFIWDFLEIHLRFRPLNCLDRSNSTSIMIWQFAFQFSWVFTRWHWKRFVVNDRYPSFVWFAH